MTHVLLFIVTIFGLNVGQDESKNDLLDGVYVLVSSHFGDVDWVSPKWKGMMIVKNGRYSRIYQEVEGNSPVSFHCNGGTLKFDGKVVKMKLGYSNFKEIRNVTYENRVTWSLDRNRLTLNAVQKGNDFQEIWKRTEK